MNEDVTISSKSKGVAIVLCIFLGLLGVHRFYVGKVGTGIIWLFTSGCFVVGWIYDLVMICNNNFTDSEGAVIRPQRD